LTVQLPDIATAGHSGRFGSGRLAPLHACAWAIAAMVGTLWI
jgi:hypothetical protein